MKFVEKIDGQDVEFPCLSVKEYEIVEEAVRANTRAELKGYLDECQVRGMDRFTALRDARPDSVNFNQVYAYTETLGGARKVALVSLKSSGMSDEKARETVERFDFMDLSNLAKALLRFSKRLRPYDDPKSGGEDPLP